MLDLSLQLCRFCQRNVKLAYYCEECGASFCTDCLNEEKIDFFVCQDCNSKNIEILKTDRKKVCKDCESENINKITQHLKSCPKCSSPKIINVYEKKEGLEQKFLELIKLSRSFLKPVRELINELYLLRQKIKDARAPPIKCYHYPKMESELLAVFKLIIYLKDNLFGKINTHFRHLALNRDFFFDIYNQPNSNIRIIESILDNLSRSHDSIVKYITDNLKDIYEKIGPFQNNLRFIEKIKKLFLPYKRFLNLAANEKPVYAIKTKLINGLNSQNRFRKSRGILFITNFDLSFVHEYGILKKKQELIFKAPVDDLIKIKDKGKLFKKLFIQFDYGKYEFSLPSHVVSKIIDYILLARSFQEDTIYNHEDAKKLQEIDLDLNDFVKYIEEGINKFFSLKIQYNQNISDSQIKKFEEANSYSNVFARNYNYQSNKTPSYQRPIYPFRNSRLREESLFNRGVNRPARVRNSQHQDYENFKENFYPQDPNDPYRFQNYRPHGFVNPGNYQRFKRQNNNTRSDFEKSILMRRLERAQKLGQQFSPDTSEWSDNYFDDAPIYRRTSPIFSENEINSFNNPHKNPKYGKFREYNKNHLSELFNFDDYSIDDIKDSFESEKNYQKKMNELKKEKFSLEETLKKLDAKFDDGNISEVDYFKFFSKLQKELYIINKKTESLKQKIEDEKFFRKKLGSRTSLS